MSRALETSRSTPVGTTVKGKTTYANEPYLDSNAGGGVAQSIGGGGGNGGWGYAFRVDDGRMSIVPAARLAWVHEFSAERPTTQYFQIAPGFNFNTDGAYAMRDALQLDAGVFVSLGERLAIYGSFTGMFSRGGRSMGGMAGFRLSF